MRRWWWWRVPWRSLRRLWDIRGVCVQCGMLKYSARQHWRCYECDGTAKSRSEWTEWSRAEDFVDRENRMADFWCVSTWNVPVGVFGLSDARLPIESKIFKGTHAERDARKYAAQQASRIRNSGVAHLVTCGAGFIHKP
jgi:hypothetical protein